MKRVLLLVPLIMLTGCGHGCDDQSQMNYMAACAQYNTPEGCQARSCAIYTEAKVCKEK